MGRWIRLLMSWVEGRGGVVRRGRVVDVEGVGRNESWESVGFFFFVNYLNICSMFRRVLCVWG